MPVVSGNPQQAPQQMPLAAAVPQQPLQPPVMPQGGGGQMQLAGSQPVPQPPRYPGIDLSGLEAGIRQEKAQEHDVAMEQMRQKHEMEMVKRKSEQAKQDAEDERRQQADFAQYQTAIARAMGIQDQLDAEHQQAMSTAGTLAAQLAMSGMSAAEAMEIVDNVVSTPAYTPQKGIESFNAYMQAAGITPEMDKEYGGKGQAILEGFYKQMAQQEQALTGPFALGEEPPTYDAFIGTPRARKAALLQEAVVASAAAAFQTARTDQEVAAVESRIKKYATDMADFKEHAEKATAALISGELGIEPDALAKLDTTNLEGVPTQLQDKTRNTVRVLMDAVAGDPGFASMIQTPPHLMTTEQQELFQGKIDSLTEALVSSWIDEPGTRQVALEMLREGSAAKVDPTTGMAVSSLLKVMKQSFGRWDNIILHGDAALKEQLDRVNKMVKASDSPFAMTASGKSAKIGDRLYNAVAAKVLSNVAAHADKGTQHYDVRNAVLPYLREAENWVDSVKAARMPSGLYAPPDAVSAWEEALTPMRPKEFTFDFLKAHGGELVSKVEMYERKAKEAMQKMGDLDLMDSWEFDAGKQQPAQEPPAQTPAPQGGGMDWQKQLQNDALSPLRSGMPPEEDDNTGGGG